MAQDQIGHYMGGTLDALRGLDDAQLAEQAEYWRECVDRSTGRDRWGYSKLLSMAHMVQSERHLTPQA